MDYKSALDYIYGFTDYEKVPGSSYSADFDLRRMEDLLERLGKPHQVARSVHVAGTKGKGSTVAMIAAVLGAAGYRVGLYTSPHLHTLRERIRVDNDLISEEEVGDLVEKLSPEVDAVNLRGAYGQLTTFEVLTALAFAYFERKGVEFQVLEVGVGGRLDATNVVNPAVCVITPISLDHTEVLGESITAIAREKAGIIKLGSTVVSALQSPEAMAVIEEVCQEKQANLLRVGSDITWQGEAFNLWRQSLRVKGRRGSYHIAIPLLGDHQLENAATAVAVIESDDIKDAIPRGIFAQSFILPAFYRAIPGSHHVEERDAVHFLTIEEPYKTLSHRQIHVHDNSFRCIRRAVVVRALFCSVRSVA